MRRLYRKVLRRNRQYFVDNLLINGEVYDELISICALDSAEAEILEQEKCNRDKVKRMILALSMKDDKVYNNFKRCLKTTKNEHVLEEIEKQERKILSEEAVPDEQVKKILLKTITQDSATTFTSLQQLQDILLNDFSTRNDQDFVEDVLDDNWLVGEIKHTFPYSTEGLFTKSTSRNRKKSGRRHLVESKEEKGFYGIKLRDASEQRYARQRQESECSIINEAEITTEDIGHQEDCSVKEATDINTEKIKLTVDEFYHWIKETLSNHCGDSSVADRFKEDDIDGSVFNELTSDELKEYIPKLGQRKKVQMMWRDWDAKPTDDRTLLQTNRQKTNDQVSQYDLKSHQQSLRPFDCFNDNKHKYKEGAYAKTVDHRRGNPLSPVHKFLQLDEDSIASSKEALSFAKEVVKFGSACMNDKTNGTLHFGIDKDKRVKGCKADFKLVERKITQTIRHLFYDGQISIALNCIRPPQFIEVIQKNRENVPLYVIEVDVVASVKFVEDLAFFLKNTDEQGTDSVLYRYENDVKLMNARETELFMKEEKMKLFADRKEFEGRYYDDSIGSRYQKLKNFLCCGGDHFEPSVYPILLLNCLQGCQIKKMDFINYVEWRAVLDFGPADATESLQNACGMVFNTNFIEDFDRKKVMENQVKQNIEILKSTCLPNWIYCNGPWQECQFTDDPSCWKMERSSSFRKAVEFYADNFPPGRGRVMIPLFKHSDELLVEAAEEVFVKFRDNCLVVAETETVSNSLKDALQKRNVFPTTSNVDDYFLVGLPWHQLSEALNKLGKQETKVEGLELQRSTGVSVKVPATFRKELCDVGILFSNECEYITLMDEKVQKDLRRNMGEDFYRGNSVSWLNFYFEDQVLMRNISMNLVQLLWDAVKGYGSFNQPVKQVVVYHQPGAGGSTTAKQALWLLKNTFRCCVVNIYTKQTSAQISRLRIYEENDKNNVNPLIVLVDLDDDEAVARLHDELECESQKHCCEVFCVMLICCRVSEKPIKAPSSSVFLQQHLTDEELHWFEAKYKDLKVKHSENQSCDPKTLLSLNVMKENFNMEVIEKYVAKYVQDPLLTTQHVQLLKYLSFVNHFDIKFQPVPKNSFDPIMETLDWIRHIPQPIRILVNPVPVNGLSGKIPCLRISNHLLARPVLDACMKMGTKSEDFMKTIGEIAKELLKSNMVNQYSRAEFNKRFEKILSDMIKKREFSHSGGKLLSFSPLIMNLFEAKDYDTAIDIMEIVYEITDDQMVAQQLARFHAEIGNWNNAYQVIDKAMSVLHDNEYLTHTRGHVHKLHFESLFKDKKTSMTEDEKLFALHIAQNARKYFKETQRISNAENVTPHNPAGFDGEIRLSIEVLKNLCIPEIAKLCQRRNHEKTVTQTPLPDCPCKFIDSIKESTSHALESLQTETHLIRLNKINLHGDYFLRLLDGNLLKTYKRDFNKFFNKSIGKQPTETNLLFSFLDATQAKDNQLIKIINHEYEQGVHIKHVQRMRLIIASYIELSLRISEKIPTSADYILNLSRQFYEKVSSSNKNHTFTSRLEAHFMMLMLHWPIQCKEPYRESLCPYPIFIKALESWKQMNDEKTNKASYDKIICYMSNEKRFPCLVRSENATSKNLHVMRGLLCANGTEIEIKPHAFKAGHAPSLKIPTLYPIRISSMWNKEVDVVLGFGLYGPKAELRVSVVGNAVKLSPRNQLAEKTHKQSEKATVALSRSHRKENLRRIFPEDGVISKHPKGGKSLCEKDNRMQFNRSGKNPKGNHSSSQGQYPYMSHSQPYPLMTTTSPIHSPTQQPLRLYVPLPPGGPFRRQEHFPPLPPSANQRQWNIPGRPT